MTKAQQRAKERKRMMKDLDNLARTIVYTRDRLTCRKCGRKAPEWRLNPSHIFERENKRLRWDEDNILTKCVACHWWWHNNQADGVKWAEEEGGVDFDELRRRRQTPFKVNMVNMRELYEDLEKVLAKYEETWRMPEEIRNKSLGIKEKR